MHIIFLSTYTYIHIKEKTERAESLAFNAHAYLYSKK